MHLNIGMDIKNCFLVYFLFAAIQLKGQTLTISFLDRKSNEVIPNVQVTFLKESTNYSDSLPKAISNFDGNVVLNRTGFFKENAFSVICNHPLYETQSKQFKFLQDSDSIRFEIYLYPRKIRELKQVVVKAPGVPDTVFSSERLSVADFEFQRNGELLLLTYPKQLHKGSELILYDGKTIKSHFEVSGEARRLLRDYRGNNHLVCNDKILAINTKQEAIELIQIPQAYFFKYIVPIVDSNTSKLYFSNFNKDYPAFDYFIFDKFDSVYKSIMNIKDDLMMELYRSEYKWVDVRTKLWAKNKERETGIDAQIWVGANYFTQSIYYKEPYAPFFQRNDSLFVFDYPKDRLIIFNYKGEVLDTVEIFHHYFPKKTGWKNKLIQDQVTGCIYAIFEKEGFFFLGMVEVKTGEISNRIKISHRYAENIKIDNDKIFYIYRPFESTQKRYLYSEKIPNQIKIDN